MEKWWIEITLISYRLQIFHLLIILICTFWILGFCVQHNRPVLEMPNFSKKWVFVPWELYLFKLVLKSAIIGSANYYPNMLLLIDWDEYCANVAKLLFHKLPDTADVLFLSGERWWDPEHNATRLQLWWWRIWCSSWGTPRINLI
jgi:hypothetical protein